MSDTLAVLGLIAAAALLSAYYRAEMALMSCQWRAPLFDILWGICQ